jgi:hypothetical protein
MRACHLLLPVLVALGACTSSGDDAQLDPPPPSGGQQLASTSYQLAPGQEIYMCYQFYSPSDKPLAITHVDTISMAGIHHMALYQTYEVQEPNAPHECMVLIKDTWLPVFVSATGSHDLQLPDGTGFIIQPKTQYVLQIHMLNATEQPLDIRGGINLTYADPTGLQPAGIYAIGNQEINIPAGATDYTVSEPCMTGKTLNIFAVLPHMHELGTEFDVTLQQQGGSATPWYTVDPWVFGNQPVAPMTYVSPPTDMWNVTCHWDNPTNAPVTYGESTTNEMCYFVFFYYPFDQLDGCIG